MQHISKVLKTYTLIDQREPDTIEHFDTKEQVLEYLSTVYWYDFNSDTVDGNYENLDEYHKSMSIDKAIALYTDNDWQLITNYK